MWIPITLVAAVFQIVRTSQQHRLAATLTASGAGAVRYLFAAPIALVLAAIWFGPLSRTVPSTPNGFFAWITVAGLAQIVATIALLRSFRVRDFAVGTTYAKTEVIQVAVISWALLGEPLSAPGWIGAAACVGGVAWLASRGEVVSVLRRVQDPAALLGIAAGGLFAVASIGIRAASTSLGEAPASDRAVLTLTTMLVIQSAVTLVQLAVSQPGELGRIRGVWRRAVPVGVLSLAGSAGWTFAMTLESAAKVRTLGQVELVLAFAIARVTHGERHRPAELAAAGLVLSGVLVVAVSG